MADFVAKHERWLEQRKGRCAAGICPNKPVEELDGKGYCRRCLRSAKIRVAQATRNRLAASQPALLAACEELWAWGQASCEGWDVSSQQAAQYGAKCLTFNEAIEQARAAIKAARGEEWKEGSK